MQPKRVFRAAIEANMLRLRLPHCLMQSSQEPPAVCLVAPSRATFDSRDRSAHRDPLKTKLEAFSPCPTQVRDNMQVVALEHPRDGPRAVDIKDLFSLRSVSPQAKINFNEFRDAAFLELLRVPSR